MVGGFFSCLWWEFVEHGFFPEETFLSLLPPLERAIALAIGPACLLAPWRLRRCERPAAHDGSDRRDFPAESAVALVALPASFPFAGVSRLPLVARLMGARLEFFRDAIAIKWALGEQRIAHHEIARTDWQHEGVLILFRDGRRLLIPTCRLPSSIGPSGHYPEIGQAVQSATFAVLRHNQEIAERIRWECERVGGPSYRHAPRFSN
jgi:hypothetical protein